jgi:hypothetical protein
MSEKCFYFIFFQTSLLDAIMFKGNGEFYITNEDPGLAAIFATYPLPYVSIAGCIIDQVCSWLFFNLTVAVNYYLFLFFSFLEVPYLHSVWPL